MKNIKILHLSKYYPPYQGGIETFLYDLNNKLNQYPDCQSDILAFNHEKGAKTETINGYLVKRFACNFLIAKTPISLGYISWLIRNSNNYDILHLHYPNPFADIALLLSNFKGKLIVHWHSDIVTQKKLELLYDPIRKLILKKASTIIVTSPTYIKGSMPLKNYNRKIEIVPLGIDTKRIGAPDNEIVTQIKSLYNNKNIIFSLGRQTYYKGFQYLIKSAKILSDDYVILIGGKGELYDQHKKYISDNFLDHKVFMVGFIDEKTLPSYYQACDIFALSSIERSEAFGVVQLEAMYFEKPIVSTAIENSGVGWVNANNETGIVVPPRDEKALADAFTLIANSKNKELYGKNGKKRFYNMFNINMISDMIYKIYRDKEP